MGSDSWKWVLLHCILAVVNASEEYAVENMSKDERESLKEEARDMFYHAYNAYMDNAYPADELMPLSCKGRFRGSESNRGDIDYALGNFSLTLVDTLDTLVVLGDFEEFENAVKLVIRDVTFDTDVIVSLFETNIRILGGLLSSHILAEYLQQRADLMTWYRGELLSLAKDLGFRFLPAFNTTTGIPYGRINLKHGMKGVPLELCRETCTACAGSMILEMAALSRLTGESIFEDKAQKAMDFLWKMRHRGTDLMGSVLNVHSGDWVRRDSGVGAGIDSYYEYCLKAYILLGDEKYLGRFNRHYQAVMKYVSQGPMLLDVHMNRPNTNTKNFMDALLAFWPGLQVLKGDIKPAVETHEMLYQVMQRHNFIPEAFTTDFQVHWGHHPLRPEFLESTYFLYKATGDHYYLNVGRKVLRSLQTFARVPCGYAAVSDVRTNKHDDTMDSFFLSETLKYLFLLFAEPNDLALNLDEFIFTTEGHLLPLSLSSAKTNISTGYERDLIHVDEMDRTCPNSLHLFPATVRQPLRNMVEDICPRRTMKRRLSASEFQASNLEHLKILNEMGITVLTLADGRIQLLHTFANAKSPLYAEEGIGFMQEMVEVSKIQAKQSQTIPLAVSFKPPGAQKGTVLLAGPAHFGPVLRGAKKIAGKVALAIPFTACTDLVNGDFLKGKIAVIHRGDCVFVEKARRIQSAGAIAGIVFDNVPGTSAAASPLFAMSGDAKDDDDIEIPLVFIFSVEAMELVNAIRERALCERDLIVTIGDLLTKDAVQLNAPTDISMFERLKGSLKDFLSRQILPQYPPSSNDLVTEHEVETEEKMTINFENLEAVIVNGPEEKEIHVTFTQPLPVNYKFSRKPEKPSSDSETLWQLIKQAFVSEIYADRAGLRMKVDLLQNLYETVMKERKYELSSVTNTSLADRVFWFLSELFDITPDPSLLHISQNVHLKIIKQKLLGHFLKPAEPKDERANFFQNVDYSILSQKLLFDKSIYYDYCSLYAYLTLLQVSSTFDNEPSIPKYTNIVVDKEKDENHFENFLLLEVERAVKDVMENIDESETVEDTTAAFSMTSPPRLKNEEPSEFGPETLAQFQKSNIKDKVNHMKEQSREMLKRIRKKIITQVRAALEGKLQVAEVDKKRQKLENNQKLQEPAVGSKTLKRHELPSIQVREKEKTESDALQQQEDSTEYPLTRHESNGTDEKHDEL